MKDSNEGLLFVEIKQPTAIRSDTLQTIKQIIQLLHKFERLRHIRHQKLEKIQKIRVLMKSANKLMGDLKTKLPQTNLRVVVAKEAPKEAEEEATASTKPSKKKGKTKAAKLQKPLKKGSKKDSADIDKLESELNAIESKLKGLT